MLVRQRSLTAAVILIGTFVGAASTLDAQSRIACIPPIGSVVTGAAPDPVDGKVQDDERWNGSMRINLNDRGAGRMGFLQLGRSATDVYIAGLIEPTDIPVSTNDAVVLAFHTSANTDFDWKIVINPFDTSTSTGASNSRNVMSGGTIMAYRKSTSQSWNTATTGFVPGAARANWLTSAIFVSRVPANTSNGWSFEMKIPIVASAASDDGIFFPPSAQFDFYFDILKAVDVADAMTIQAPWPTDMPSAKVIGSASDFVGDNTLPLPWGKVSFDPATCTGVTLTRLFVTGSPSDHQLATFAPVAPYPAFPADCTTIPSSPPPNTPIAAATNTLNVEVKNTHATLNLSGVTAKVYVAQWGIASPSEYLLLDPAATTPIPGLTVSPPTITLGPLTVNAGGVPQDLSLQWRMTYRQSCDYTRFQGGHHCMFAQLDAPTGGVNVPLVVSSRGDNFMFVPASTFSNVATISNRYKDLLTSNQRNDFALVVTATKEQFRPRDNVFVAVDDRQARSEEIERIPLSMYPKGLAEAVRYTVSGYRFGDGRLILNSRTGKRYRVGQYVGSYGYLAGHDKAAATWQASLTGDGIKEAAKGVYQLTIQIGSAARVLDTIQAYDGRPQDAPPIPSNATKGWGCMRRTPPAPIIGIVLVVGLYAYRPRRRDDDDRKSQ